MRSWRVVGAVFFGTFATKSMIDFLHHPETERIITQALAEDIGSGDITSQATIPLGTQRRARCLAKESGIVAGVQFAEQVFKKVDTTLVFVKILSDGAAIKPGDIIFEISGSAHAILAAERLVLNSLQRMSGIATMTATAVNILSNTQCKILDTRKTTPLIRHLEKWAVTIGGGENHRFGLYDMILIKDNHIDYAGGISTALRQAVKFRQENFPQTRIEIECRTLDEVREAIMTGGMDIILLDNMPIEMIKEAVSIINKRCLIEVSGNVTIENLASKALPGVDFISMGALTHSIKSLDISLKAY